MKSGLLLPLFALSLSIPASAGVTVDPATSRSTYIYEFDALNNLSICRGFHYASTSCEKVPAACAQPTAARQVPALPVVTRPVHGVQTGVCDSRDTVEECNDLIVAMCARYARSNGDCSSEKTDDECHSIAVSSGLCPAPESTTIPDFVSCTLFLDWFIKERILSERARLGREERQREAVLPTARIDDVEEIRDP